MLVDRLANCEIFDLLTDFTQLFAFRLSVYVSLQNKFTAIVKLNYLDLRRLS